MRLDIVTRRSYPKDLLLRFVYSNGILVFDKNQTMSGRGVYISPSSMENPKIERCLSKAFKSNITIKIVKDAING